MTEENETKESQIQEETVSSLSEDIKEEMKKEVSENGNTAVDEKTPNLNKQSENGDDDVKGILIIASF